VQLKKPKLLNGAIPSIFPGCPISCIPKIIKNRKSPKKRDDVSTISKIDHEKKIISAKSYSILSGRYNNLFFAHNMKIYLDIILCIILQLINSAFNCLSKI